MPEYIHPVSLLVFVVALGVAGLGFFGLYRGWW
jgi:hypothetical protein